MSRYVDNIRKVFANDNEVGSDRADLTQVVIITAGFSVAGLLLMSWLSAAILNAGADVANCFERSNFDGAESASSCENAEYHYEEHSFENNESFTSRFGGTVPDGD